MKEKIKEVITLHFNNLEVDIYDLLKNNNLLDDLKKNNISIGELIKYFDEIKNEMSTEIIYEPVDFILCYYGLEEEYTCYTSNPNFKISYMMEGRNLFMLDKDSKREEHLRCNGHLNEYNLNSKIILSSDNNLYYVPTDLSELFPKNSYPFTRKPCILRLIFSDEQLERLALISNEELCNEKLYLENGVRLIDEINRLVTEEQCGFKRDMDKIMIPFYKNKKITLNDNDVKFANILCRYLEGLKVLGGNKYGLYGDDLLEYLQIKNSNNYDSILSVEDILKLKQIFRQAGYVDKINFYLNDAYPENAYAYNYRNKTMNINSTNIKFIHMYSSYTNFNEFVKKYQYLSDDTENLKRGFSGAYLNDDSVNNVGFLSLDIKNGLCSTENIMLLYKQIIKNNIFLKLINFKTNSDIMFKDTTIGEYFLRKELYAKTSYRTVQVKEENIDWYNRLMNGIEAYADYQQETLSELINLFRESINDISFEDKDKYYNELMNFYDKESNYYKFKDTTKKVHARIKKM